MSNEYGLDYKYFEGKLSQIARDASRYTPGEMYRELSKYVEVAISQMDDNAPLSIKDLEQQNEALKRENEALLKAISNHNEACISDCNARSDTDLCKAYTNRGRDCTECPKDYLIQLTNEGEG